MSFARGVSAVLRMLLPFCALSLILLATFALTGEPFRLLDGFLPPAPVGTSWLHQSDVIVCLTFLVVALISRAYGPLFSMSFVMLAWTIFTVIAVWQLRTLTAAPLSGGEMPSGAVVAAAGIALCLGHLVSVAVFDFTRGTNWWTAPLWSTLLGSAVYVLVFRLSLFAVSDGASFVALAADLGAKWMMALAMLPLYLMARPVIRPRPGYGGA